MAWDGLMRLELKGDMAKLVFTKLDADNEETYTLYPVDVGNHLPFQPKHAKLISTHAAAVVYDLALQGSIDATNWVDILTNTAKDTIAQTVVDYTAATGDPRPAAYLHYRIFLADDTDGAAAEHTATVFLES